MRKAKKKSKIVDRYRLARAFDRSRCLCDLDRSQIDRRTQPNAGLDMAPAAVGERRSHRPPKAAFEGHRPHPPYRKNPGHPDPLILFCRAAPAAVQLPGSSRLCARSHFGVVWVDGFPEGNPSRLNQPPTQTTTCVSLLQLAPLPSPNSSHHPRAHARIFPTFTCDTGPRPGVEQATLCAFGRHLKGRVRGSW